MNYILKYYIISYHSIRYHMLMISYTECMISYLINMISYATSEHTCPSAGAARGFACKIGSEYVY